MLVSGTFFHALIIAHFKRAVTAIWLGLKVWEEVGWETNKKAGIEGERRKRERYYEKQRKG